MRQEVQQTVMDQGGKVLDGLAVGTTVAALMGWLPAIAALFTIIWTAIRIWETDTVKTFINKLRKK